MEIGEPNHRIRIAGSMHLANIRVILRELAGSAGIAEPDDFPASGTSSRCLRLIQPRWRISVPEFSSHLVLRFPFVRPLTLERLSSTVVQGTGQPPEHRCPRRS